AIKHAWSYFFEPRVLSWEQQFRLDHFRFGIAIVAQTRPNAEKSGLVFSVDPITGDKNKLVIEAIYGLPDMLSSGKVTPDRYVINKRDSSIEDKTIVKQEKAMVYKDKDKYINE